MHAAVVSTFDSVPEYTEVTTPMPGAGERLVTVLASALHPRVRSQADGSHYTSSGRLPLIPGVDGVGRTEEGELIYAILSDDADGFMADHAVIDPRRSIVLPDNVDPVLIAAAMNPAMSSWLALRRRVDFHAGSRVLVMGATGSAGRFAVQIAKRQGARHVTAAGRNPAALAQLPELGADVIIDLARDPQSVAADLAAVGHDVDVVLDYLWGTWAASTLRTIVPTRDDPSQPLTWIHIGSMSGLESPIPSAVLRACDLRIVGSGQGSVSARDIRAELPALVDEITNGSYSVPVRPMPLAAVTHAWAEAANVSDRIVLVP